jgi:DNA-binding NtrC family response regulator
MDAAVATLSVLVADDEEGIRGLLRHWLEDHGHHVVTVASAQEATRILGEQSFDVVITDIVMPDGDGYELIGMFRKAQPGARIVAISGGGRYLQGNDCLRIARGLGAHAAVKKPFNWEQLHAGILQAFASTPAVAS